MTLSSSSGSSSVSEWDLFGVLGAGVRFLPSRRAALVGRPEGRRKEGKEGIEEGKKREKRGKKEGKVNMSGTVLTQNCTRNPNLAAKMAKIDVILA